MRKAKLYKVTLPDGSACHGGSGKWYLPKGKKPGKWMPAVKNPACCRRGYHLVTAEQLLGWLDKEGLCVWEAEARGAVDAEEDKSAHEQARLIRKVGDWLRRGTR